MKRQEQILYDAICILLGIILIMAMYIAYQVNQPEEIEDEQILHELPESPHRPEWPILHAAEKTGSICCLTAL